VRGDSVQTGGGPMKRLLLITLLIVLMTLVLVGVFG
jgi:hypothetical protein